MLTNRIIGAFRLRKDVFAEVEKDTSFTTTAWILVVVVSFLSQLGSFASTNLLRWLIGAIGGTIFAILGFAVGVLVINWVGRFAFKADVSYAELVRTLGLAYVWQVIGVLGILTTFTNVLSGELYMVRVVAVVMMVIAWFIAAKEALDLDWIPAAVTIALGWMAQFATATVIARLVLGLIELGVAAIR